MMVQKQLFFSLLGGIAVGFTLAFMVLSSTTLYRPEDSYQILSKFNVKAINDEIEKNAHEDIDDETTMPLRDTHGHYHLQHDIHDEEDMSDLAGPDDDVGYHDENDTFHQMTDTRVADVLYNKVRVLCWVMTGPQNHEKKAKHVKATWGKRCNVLLFMSSTEDENLPAVALPVGEGRDQLWAKTKEAFKYVYENYFDEADWFMKADDDTYVILENLRYMLLPENPAAPVYFGCKFKPYVSQGYMSGGAGYVLSKEALKRFVEKGLTISEHCRKDGRGAEDVEMGKCMEDLGVVAGDSRDHEGRGRFFPFTPGHHLIPGHVDKSFWYWKYIFYDEKQGMECCSDNAVSFHYVPPDSMYVFEYLIYHLRPFGIAYTPQLASPYLESESQRSATETSDADEEEEEEEYDKK